MDPAGQRRVPLRLAVLQADTPLPGIDARYGGGYLGVFRHLFARAVAPAPLDSVLSLTGYDVVGDPDSYPSLEDGVDAVLITGSKHSAFGDDAWIKALVEFTRKALLTTSPPEGEKGATTKKGVRVVGVCFGHQIVARALGTMVARSDRGWEVSVTETRLTEKGKELFGKDTLQMHRDQAFGLPAGAELLAESDKCANHGFVMPGRAITVQGHPEFTEDMIREILEARHATGLFSDELFQSGMDRKGNEQDGVLMARVFLKFIQQQE
ncbi:class I glutamine amidotransferase-like protein [Lasiosphaeria miniovina]|uniref:Class I glutamine amidotransferase-like protein n=1 Tax=Lasiosphaeria miniovina TaxID=1954250 RepID=A0AA40ATG4_9PEZI|nr:class I glutamine amidotransferase-like protein [Lasiosphaeria miniovina]KAK0721708.1 class I glutamine amidotransferase-like protein [Lasiosphaeria miniovina]